MRIPFDLIAAVLLMDGVGKFLGDPRAYDPSRAQTGMMALLWLGFFLVTWLANELVVRRVEWATRFGQHPAGVPGSNGMHPMELLTWGTRGVHALTVVLYGLILWTTEWPLFTHYWPEWFGWTRETVVRIPYMSPVDAGLQLSNSGIAAMALDLGPFVIAMMLGWLPRRRLVSSARRRPISIFSFLIHEIKLSWLPLLMWLAIAIVGDALAFLPHESTDWMAEPGMSLVILLLFIGLLSVVILPVFVIWWWECTPLPDGDLKNRLLGLMERSGVKARAILVWGPKNSGILNACVLGPWARFRYVLISPSLVDELGMEETEAVLAHELGHARYGHLTLLFVMILCMSALLDPLSSMVPFSSPVAQAGVLIAFVILYIYLFFGSIMRRCEREADLASAELLGTPQPLVEALEKLARISGNIRNVYCWHHGSIAQRVEAVQQLSVDATGRIRLHKELRRMRILFVVLTIVAVCAQFVQRLS
ncbi:MAG TPA: M48 family metallopeptidase [Planctomycetota bacterium]|nr:M48 family metallopeptidase [Planctomycetota bacterium]